jgi:hypothetical protein
MLFKRHIDLANVGGLWENIPMTITPTAPSGSSPADDADGDGTNGFRATFLPPSGPTFGDSSVWAVPGMSPEFVAPSPFPFAGRNAAEGVAREKLERAFAARRLAEVAIVQAMNEITATMTSIPTFDARESAVPDRNVTELLVSVGRISLAEAHRFRRVAAATETRSTLHGETLPATYPLLQAAFTTGSIPVDSAHHIAAALTTAAPRANPDDMVEAERKLAAFAAEAPVDSVHKLAIAYRDALDVDGIEPREQVLTGMLALKRTMRPNGMKRYVLDADPLSSAYLDAAIDVHVTAALARPDAITYPNVPIETRSIGMIAAEALIDLARHGAACSNTEIPIRATTIVVRMTLDALMTGLGEANIDGIGEPISAGTARQLAATAGVIPIVLGGDSVPLDLGRTRRGYSKEQRIVMGGQYGGCAFPNCGLPPSHTEVHHVVFWRNNGRTDYRNGIPLCVKHHHDVHRYNWTIEMRGAIPWFIPPTSIDPKRRPIRGGTTPTPFEK